MKIAFVGLVTQRSKWFDVTMAGLLGNHSRLFRLFHVLDFVGSIFPTLTPLTTVIQKFVYDQKPENLSVSKKKKSSATAGPCGEDVSVFIAETGSLLDLYPELKKERLQVFKSFHDFSVQCGNPIATILVSKRENCRICNKLLLLDGNTHVVVIYHEQYGTYLGSRVTKYCNNCKVHEHYGYWTVNGERKFEEDCLKNEFLLSSEDTAVGLSLLRQCANLLVVGAVPFSTYTKSYNRKFGYRGILSTAENLSGEEINLRMKRKKR